MTFPYTITRRQLAETNTWEFKLVNSAAEYMGVLVCGDYKHYGPHEMHIIYLETYAVGHGYGNALLQACAVFALSINRAHMSLECSGILPRLPAYHAKRGFVAKEDNLMVAVTQEVIIKTK